MKISRHIPAAARDDDYVPEIAEFSNLEELKSIPWVASWITDPTFKQLSFSPPERKCGCLHAAFLMAELKDSFWVLGYMDADPTMLGLPEWVAPAEVPN